MIAIKPEVKMFAASEFFRDMRDGSVSLCRNQDSRDGSIKGDFLNCLEIAKSDAGANEEGAFIIPVLGWAGKTVLEFADLHKKGSFIIGILSLTPPDRNLPEGSGVVHALAYVDGLVYNAPSDIATRLIMYVSSVLHDGDVIEL